MEINNLKDERIDLIEKINSINDVIKGENIVRNVFINDVKENHTVIEASKKKKMIK